MTGQKIKIIVNPNADLGRAWRSSAELKKIVSDFGEADWSGTVFPVHAKELALKAGHESYDLVIAAGGDGTIHEVVNGLMEIPHSSRPRLGIIPFGSGNDFSHSLGIDPRPSYAIKQIFTGEPRPVDIGKISTPDGRVEYWHNTLGIGLDTVVVLRFQHIKRLRGFTAYMTAVLQTVIKNLDAPHMKVVTDRESWEDDILMLVTCNGSREGGGFLISPEANPSDKVFNYAWVEKVSRLKILQILPEVMKGTHERFPEVRIGKFESMKVVSDQVMFIHTDGEIFAGFDSDIKELEVQILPGALEIIS